jgi:hypothetical protein
VWSASRPGRLYPQERPGAHCTGGWVGPGAGLDRRGKSRPTGIRSPDPLARSESLYRLRYPGSPVSISKGKAVPLQAWSGPEGSSKLRFPDFMTTAKGGGKVACLTHRPPLPPGNTPGTHLC